MLRAKENFDVDVRSEINKIIMAQHRKSAAKVHASPWLENLMAKKKLELTYRHNPSLNVCQGVNGRILFQRPMPYRTAISTLKFA